MQELLELAGGSIAGREHLRIGKNNQDAYYGVCSEGYAIAVVCDGCGSCDRSEVGAKVGAKLVANAIAKALTPANPRRELEFWEQVQQDVLNQLHHLVVAMGGDFVETVRDYFLFTIVGALVTPTHATLFSIGDGVMIINGEVKELGPFANNAPPYLAYSLLNGQETCMKRENWQGQFKIKSQLAFDELQSIVIGTDGLIDLIKASDRLLPGKQETIGAISQFWEKDCYFKNPDRVRRQLSLINRDVQKIDWKNQQILKEVGLLPDDTTLMVIRKKSSQWSVVSSQ